MSKVLIGVPVKNCARWVETMVQEVVNLSYPKELLTVVFVENDSEDDSFAVLRDRIMPRLSQLPYRAVHLVKHDTGFKLSHFQRHLPEFASARFKALSEIRRFIIDNYLSGNDYLCQFDADFERIPTDTIERLVRFGVDLIAPIFTTPDGTIYGLGTKKLVDGVWLTADKIAARYPNEEIIEVDGLEPTLFSRKVLGVVRYPPDGSQESTIFALRAKEGGFKLWLATKIVIVHAPINGMVREIPYSLWEK